MLLCMKYYIDTDLVKIYLSNATENTNIDVNLCMQHVRPEHLIDKTHTIINC